MAGRDDAPLVLAAVLCEHVLEEKDGVLTATRIVDRFVADRSAQVAGPHGVQVHYLAMLRRGAARIAGGEHEATIMLRHPSGQIDVVTRTPWKLSWPHGEAQDEGVNLNVTLAIGLTEEGLYWL